MIAAGAHAARPRPTPRTPPRPASPPHRDLRRGLSPGPRPPPPSPWDSDPATPRDLVTPRPRTVTPPLSLRESYSRPPRLGPQHTSPPGLRPTSPSLTRDSDLQTKTTAPQDGDPHAPQPRTTPPLVPGRRQEGAGGRQSWWRSGGRAPEHARCGEGRCLQSRSNSVTYFLRDSKGSA